MAVLLFAEVSNGKLNEATAKALTAAKALNEPVHALVAGENLEAAAQAAASLDISPFDLLIRLSLHEPERTSGPASSSIRSSSSGPRGTLGLHGDFRVARAPSRSER